MRSINTVAYKNRNWRLEPCPAELYAHAKPGSLLGIWFPNSPFNKRGRPYTHIALVAAATKNDVILFQNNRNGVVSPISLKKFLRTSGGHVVEVLSPPKENPR